MIRVFFIKNRILWSDYVLKNIALVLFSLRPLIDLAWADTYFWGLNLAGITAIVLILIMLIDVVSSKNHQISLYLFFFLIYMVMITALYSKNYSDFDTVLRFSSTMVFFVTVAPKINNKELDRTILFFCIATIVPIILSFAQLVGIIPYTYWDYIEGIVIERASGGYRQPSVLTRFCIFGLIYALYFLESRKNTILKKLLIFLYIAINLVSIIISYHRTSYLMVFVIFILWNVLKYRNRISQYFSRVLFLFIFGVLIFLLSYEFGIVKVDLNIFRKLISLDNVFIYENGHFNLILRGRGNILNLLFETLYNSPIRIILFGNGININQITNTSMQIADMDFIRVIWNFGVIGLLLWVGHLFYLSNILIYCKSYVDSLYFRVGCILLLTYILWGFTVEVIGTPNIGYHSFLVIGYLYFQAKKKKKIMNISGEEN